MMRLRCDASSTPDNPPGYSSYALTPSGVAVGVANWVEYSQARRRAAGQELGDYTFFIQNWGDPGSAPNTERTNTFALGRNWADRVTGVGIADADAVNTPWCENGIALLRAWTEEFLDALVVQLDTRGLPYPTDIHWDWETRALGSAMLGGSGVWAAMQADARWSANSIDGNPANTMANLWAAARKSDGSPMTVNAAASIFTSANAEFEAWIGGTIKRAMEYALHKSLYELCRERFPGILCGNYDYIPRTTNQTWWRLTKSFSPRTVANAFAFPNTDYANFQTYLPPNSTFNPSSPGTLQEFMAVYGLPYTGVAATDYRAFWMEYQKANMRAVRTYYEGPLAIWLPFPGAPETYTSPAATLTTTTDDIVELATYAARELGVTEFLWFMNSATNPDTSLPFLANTDEYPDMIAAINEAVVGHETSASVRTVRRRRRRR